MLPVSPNNVKEAARIGLGAQVLEKANSICSKLQAACGNHWKPVFIVAGIIATAVGAFMAIPGAMFGGTVPGGVAAGLGCMMIGIAVHGYYKVAQKNAQLDDAAQIAESVDFWDDEAADDREAIKKIATGKPLDDSSEKFSSW